jgi:hypothetical protein
MSIMTTAILSSLALGAADDASGAAREPAVAPQTRPQVPPAAAPYDLPEVVVTAPRRRGAAQTTTPPERVLDRNAILSFGAGTVQELLSYIAPLTEGPSGSRPAILINGRRISGPQELMGVPPEALERAEILPPSVAVEYGFAPDQKVLNIVFNARVRTLTTEASLRAPEAGGQSAVKGSSGLLRVVDDRRWGIDVEVERETALYETDRDIRRSPDGLPFDLTGNVRAAGGGEVDPALSALVGRPVLEAPAPDGAGPGLADFANAFGPLRSDGLTAYRPLIPETSRSILRGTFTPDLGEVTASVSGSIQQSSSDRFNGLPGVVLNLPASSPASPFAAATSVYRFIDDPDAMRSSSESFALRAGAALSGFVTDDWRWSATADVERSTNDSRVGRGLEAVELQARINAGDPDATPFGPLASGQFERIEDDTAHTVATQANGEVVFNGRLGELPAGAVRATVKGGLTYHALDASSRRLGLTSDRTEDRTGVAASGALVIPVTSRSNGPFSSFGDLTVTVNGRLDSVSDFGLLQSFGVTTAWTPAAFGTVQLSYNEEGQAPGIGQLNDPVIVTPNTPVFDYATGQTTTIDVISGGVPDLQPSRRKTWRASLNLKPFDIDGLVLTSAYTHVVMEDLVGSAPTLSLQAEAALPDRYVRDAAGRLMEIDLRPLNLDRSEKADMRTGLTYTGFLGGGGLGVASTTEQLAASALGGAAGLKDRPFVNLSLFHSWRLKDQLSIRPDLPVLDLLNGSATGGQGGSARHDITATASLAKSGAGLVLMAAWREGSTIRNGPQAATLEFSDTTMVNVNLFADLSRNEALVARMPWLDGVRVSVGVTNLLDDHATVTASQGEVPLPYQSDYLDPRGRVFSIVARKLLS